MPEFNDQPCPSEGHLEVNKTASLGRDSKSGDKVNFEGEIWKVKDRGSDSLNPSTIIFELVHEDGRQKEVRF